ncbi:TetR/AcrR family transcriptional regulator [Deinococcus humi]|uniref:AcrR family transcriptional regulator n=1 Tax=Deinococcus humi TaxID=662880 RepID=A0A7W8JY72_9DEIO|nr:helix-turn-helix domain-containing protein [Deinococcus humi]MBB5363879.1 AcrR family transcriptional regulator [Deinococcus humi]
MSGSRSRGRPRSPLADTRILEAACALVLERGLDAVGMEDVAVRACVSKTTLYRRYPDKLALTTALIDHVLSGVPEPVTSGQDPIRALLGAAATYYGSVGGRVALALLPAARREPIRSLAVGLTAPKVIAEQSRILAAAPGIDAEAVINLALGAVVFYVERHGRPPEDVMLDRWARALHDSG